MPTPETVFLSLMVKTPRHVAVVAPASMPTLPSHPRLPLLSVCLCVLLLGTAVCGLRPDALRWDRPVCFPPAPRMGVQLPLPRCGTLLADPGVWFSSPPHGMWPAPAIT